MTKPPLSHLDVDYVRSRFPAFGEENLKGWGFFENAGGSYACVQVIDRLNRYYRETKVQPYGYFPASARAGEEMDAARDRLAALLNVEPRELSFGPSTSQNTYVLANAFRAGLEKGAEIIVTQQDHEANSGVWRRLASDDVTVKEWRVDPETGALDPNDLDELLSPATRLVTMPHCSNIVAIHNDVAAVAEKVHAAGALLLVDGVSYAPHGLPDIASLGADIYLFSLYKTFGPHQGAMVVRGPLLDRLENQGHFFNAGLSDKRLTPAGPDHAQVSAVNGVVDYYEDLDAHHFGGGAAPADMARRVNALFAAHEHGLAERLLAYLRDRDDIRILGPASADNRAATISLLPNRSPVDVAKALSEHRIMAGAGHFYALRLIEALNVPADPGVLRLSLVHYTSDGDVDRLLEALERSL